MRVFSYLVMSLCDPWTVARQAMGFSRQEYWSGLPFPYSTGSSWPKNRTRITCVSWITGRFFTLSAIRETHSKICLVVNPQITKHREWEEPSGVGWHSAHWDWWASTDPKAAGVWGSVNAPVVQLSRWGSSTIPMGPLELAEDDTTTT